MADHMVNSADGTGSSVRNAAYDGDGYSKSCDLADGEASDE